MKKTSQKKFKTVLVKVKLPPKIIKELKAEARKEKRTLNDYIVSCLTRFIDLVDLGYITALDDAAWGKLATEALKEGTIGPEASEKLMAEMMKSKKTSARRPKRQSKK